VTTLQTSFPQRPIRANDILSNDPKRLLLECDECCDRYGTPEGYFLCDGCERLMIENRREAGFY